MKIQRSTKLGDDLSMASSSDIAFLLIIFFMVTSAFIFKDGLHLVLPDKNQKPEVVKANDINVVTLANTDKLLLGEKKVTDELLTQKLLEILAKDPEAVVLFKVGKEVQYQRMVEIFDLIKNAGTIKLSLKMI